MDLLPFQRRFRKAVLSISRGNGKSTLAASFCLEMLSPGSPFYYEGLESVLVAASLAQARRTVLAQLIRLLPHTGDYKVATSSNNACFAKRRECGTQVSVLTASYRSAQGLVETPWLVADEPGAWLPGPGESMFDAIATAAAKPSSAPLTAVFIGTLAPATEGWWHDLVKGGTHGSTYVQSLQGDPRKWSDLREVRRCNPLMYRFPKSRAKLREERDAALRDTRLKARFKSYRLNLPSQDEATMLLAVGDWQTMAARPVPPRQGRPVVGIDLGAGRAWSAATAIWPNGRTEAIAVAPGIPDLRAQEKRDRVPAGTYQRLHERGVLHVAAGLRVQPPADLVRKTSTWNPLLYISDRFRHSELLDCVPSGVPVVPRVTRWSESSADIRGLRILALDGNLSIARESAPLLRYSLGCSRVEQDTSGNCRLVKSGSNNTGRDDVAHGLALAAGWVHRNGAPRAPSYAVAR